VGVIEECDYCDGGFDTSAGYIICDTCYAIGCYKCEELIKRFNVGEKRYCEKCYPDPNKKRHYSKQEKLDFLMEHVKMTEAELLALMPPLDTTPNYVCTKTEEHGCVTECETLGDDWEGCRGLCCKAKDIDLCDACCKKIKL
jgi:hypothetical protein